MFQLTKKTWIMIITKLIFSTITPVIIEMHILWLEEDCIISQYYHLIHGDYSRSAKFQDGCLIFCQYYRGSDEGNKENTIPKSTKMLLSL